MISNPAVTVGVPVHNGGLHLRACLECLRTQTFKDIQVVIFENCSTDLTLEIAKEFLQRDERFSLRSSEKLLPAADNFRRAIEYCSNQSEFFLLRAHDDTSDSEFIQILWNSLQKNKEKELAVPGICYVKDDKFFEHTIDESILNTERFSTFRRSPHHLAFPASWYYGLYRGPKAAQIMLNTLTSYPYYWGGDMLLVLKFILRNKVAYRKATTFYCRLSSQSEELCRERSPKNQIKVRYLYFKEIIQYSNQQHDMNLFKKLAYYYLCWRCARKHTTYKTRHIITSALMNIRWKKNTNGQFF